MQEVNAVHYDEFFEPELKQLGEPLSKTPHVVTIIIIILFFFYSANSRMVDRCTVQDIINVLININVNYIN